MLLMVSQYLLSSPLYFFFFLPSEDLWRSRSCLSSLYGRCDTSMGENGSRGVVPSFIHPLFLSQLSPSADLAVAVFLTFTGKQKDTFSVMPLSCSFLWEEVIQAYGRSIVANSFSNTLKCILNLIFKFPISFQKDQIYHARLHIKW